MKKCIAFLIVLATTFGLSACKTPVQQKAEEGTAATALPTAAPAAAATEATVLPTTAPTAVTTEESAAETTALTADAPTAATAETVTEVPAETPTAAATAADPTEVPPTEVPTEAPTEVPHSDLYVAGVSPDQIVTYFNEAVLDAEPAVVEKWERPIAYRIEGVPSRRDAQVISQLSKKLNSVEGFPGIQAATGLEQNLTIYFLREAEFKTQFAHLLGDEPADGVMQFWCYNDTNDIYTGRIGYRKDAEQNIKDSVIPEELLNALGVGNTALREDSITYQNGNEITELSEVDWAIIKLLYNPKIKCGMNAAECETIIRELYY